MGSQAMIDVVSRHREPSRLSQNQKGEESGPRVCAVNGRTRCRERTGEEATAMKSEFRIALATAKMLERSHRLEVSSNETNRGENPHSVRTTLIHQCQMFAAIMFAF